MPGTYSQILLHAVYSTKHRAPWLTGNVTERLYPYMGGLVRARHTTLNQHQQIVQEFVSTIIVPRRSV